MKKEDFMLQDMKLTAINTEKVHNQVYEQLKHLLLEGTWKPGEKIPSENKLTNIFGVSRISVRSAIKSLIAQGFLEARQGEGTFVVDVSIDQNFNLLIPMMNYSRESILEVLEFRRVFEVGMMPVVIEKITPEQIQELENNVIALEQADFQHGIECYLRFVAEFLRLLEAGEVTEGDWADFHSHLQERWQNILRRKQRGRSGVSPVSVGQEVYFDTVDADWAAPLGAYDTHYPYFTSGAYHRLADNDDVYWRPDFPACFDEEE